MCYGSVSGPVDRPAPALDAAEEKERARSARPLPHTPPVCRRPGAEGARSVLAAKFQVFPRVNFSDYLLAVLVAQ